MYAVIYHISRKFGMDLNLVVGSFLWRSPNLFHQLQVLLYNVTLEPSNKVMKFAQPQCLVESRYFISHSN